MDRGLFSVMLNPISRFNADVGFSYHFVFLLGRWLSLDKQPSGRMSENPGLYLAVSTGRRAALTYPKNHPIRTSWLYISRLVGCTPCEARSA